MDEDEDEVRELVWCEDEDREEEGGDGEDSLEREGFAVLVETASEAIDDYQHIVRRQARGWGRKVERTDAPDPPLPVQHPRNPSQHAHQRAQDHPLSHDDSGTSYQKHRRNPRPNPSLVAQQRVLDPRTRKRFSGMRIGMRMCRVKGGMRGEEEGLDVGEEEKGEKEDGEGVVGAGGEEAGEGGAEGGEGVYSRCM